MVSYYVFYQLHRTPYALHVVLLQGIIDLRTTLKSQHYLRPFYGHPGAHNLHFYRNNLAQ